MTMLSNIINGIKQITFDNITLFLLGIFSIRQLIAQNIDIPLPKKLKWLIYNKKDLESPVLCRRAYDMSHQIGENKPSRTIVEQLLEMDGRHIKYYEDGLVHGRSSGTQVQSKYFINTLEASYSETDLSIMTTAIRALIANGNLNVNKIDFVLCFKSGNQILARNIYNKRNGEIIYICRLDDYAANYPMKPNAEAHLFSVQFENLDTLLTAAQNYRMGKLNGIAIDCSISTGAGLKEGIKQFNELIEQDNLNINKIEHAFVLYAHKLFDDANCKEFTLHRYFDMDEKTRELIYNASQGKITYQEIYQHLKKEKLLRQTHN